MKEENDNDVMKMKNDNNDNEMKENEKIVKKYY